MKVAIAYPPMDSDQGVALLSQNRQFQYFKEPTFIYPVVPATAATMLKQAGYEVLWLDGIAAGMTRQQFLEELKSFEPDVVAMETKTPVVKKHWSVIADIKKMSSTARPVRTVLFGDHVTALPQESFENSAVDFVLTGGDYDFLLVNLCRYLEHFSDVKFHNSDIGLEPGIWFRDGGAVKSTGDFKLSHDLNTPPFIDRVLTKWEMYAYKNGNFKRTPGTYMMSGRDCWWGKCTFCSWPTLYPTVRWRKPGLILDEISSLVEKHGVREVMDDSGTFPVGEWLKEFCKGMIERQLNHKVVLDCNMRFGVLSPFEYRRMKEAGFRLVLFGLESANQATLDRVRKNVTVADIIESCKSARKEGLYPHITIMFGYPWESYEDALKTLNLGRWLLKKGYAYTVQATVVIPYPGSKLFDECQAHDWLRTTDWSDYDMKTPVMKTSIPDEAMGGLVQGIYRVAFDPEFIARRIASVRSLSDLNYFARGVKKVMGHIWDFKKV